MQPQAWHLVNDRHYEAYFDYLIDAIITVKGLSEIFGKARFETNLYQSSGIPDHSLF